MAAGLGYGIPTASPRTLLNPTLLVAVAHMLDGRSQCAHPPCMCVGWWLLVCVRVRSFRADMGLAVVLVEVVTPCTFVHPVSLWTLC